MFKTVFFDTDEYGFEKMDSMIWSGGAPQGMPDGIAPPAGRMGNLPLGDAIAHAVNVT